MIVHTSNIDCTNNGSFSHNGTRSYALVRLRRLCLVGRCAYKLSQNKCAKSESVDCRAELSALWDTPYAFTARPPQLLACHAVDTAAAAVARRVGTLSQTHTRLTQTMAHSCMVQHAHAPPEQSTHEAVLRAPLLLAASCAPFANRCAHRDSSNCACTTMDSVGARSSCHWAVPHATGRRRRSRGRVRAGH